MTGYFSALISKKPLIQLSTPFILAILESFGFGPQFIHWVRVILN